MKDCTFNNTYFKCKLKGPQKHLVLFTLESGPQIPVCVCVWGCGWWGWGGCGWGVWGCVCVCVWVCVCVLGGGGIYSHGDQRGYGSVAFGVERGGGCPVLALPGAP